MSVTFSIITRPAAGQEWGEFVRDDLDLNVSNANARTLLDVLGYVEIGFAPSVELCGTQDGADFLGRVLTGLVLSPQDAGVPAHEMVPADDGVHGGPTMIDCGRRPGYVQDQLHRLWDLAEEAARLDARITWG